MQIRKMITIERDEGLTDKVHLSLRFGFENENRALQLAKHLADNGITYEMRPPSRWSVKHKVNIDNLESATFDGKLIKEVIHNLQILPTEYDFFLGITSAYQLGGFTVPDNVIEYIRIIGGKVEVSYSCSYSEE